MSRAAVKAKGSAPTTGVLMAAPVIDESWEVMMASFRAAKKPAKWKYQIVDDTGACFNARYVDGRFVRSHLGQELTLMPHSLMLEMEQRGIEGKTFQGSVATCPDTTRGFIDCVLELRTGNHQPRNHPVKVPTAPGQPVRG